MKWFGWYKIIFLIIANLKIPLIKIDFDDILNIEEMDR